MGLGNIPLDSISKSKVARKLRKPAYNHGNPINAFDTETTDKGKIYLLSYIYDKEGFGPAYVGNEDFSPLTAKKIFDILVKSQTRQPAINVWANLDFDVNALIGTILDEKNMEELADTNKTSFEVEGIEYEMTYITKKFLSISDENGHKSTHYDILQFFGTSLENAAEEWLDIDKLGLDAANLSQYSWREITKYAMRDAEATQELWKKFVDLGENTLGIPLGKPISTGFVAQHVVFDTLAEKPKWGSSHFQELARKAYHGGRFEVYRRGYFDNVIGLDINSAYPNHMSKMPDLDTCNIQVTGGSIEDMRNADWGFVSAKVSTDMYRNIQPFAIKDKSLRKHVCFPALDNYSLTCTIDEFLFALDNDYLTDFTINKTGLVYETSNTQRPFSFLKEWYDDRRTYKHKSEKDGDKYDKFQFIVKIIMNSVYGKTCQVTEKNEYLDDSETFTAKKNEYVTEGYSGLPIKGWYEGGDLFNPFYASYITALTRLQLHKAALELGIENQTIMFATDCIMIESDAVSQNHIDKMLKPDDLGKWDFDYKGSAYVVGSGVYDVKKDGELVKMARRGFKEVTKNYDSWRQASEISNGTIQLQNERPAKFKEWLLHEGHPRPAEFFQDERNLSPDFDSKRNWENEATFERLLSSNHGSDPLELAL